jgi:hypothetical protein
LEAQSATARVNRHRQQERIGDEEKGHEGASVQAAPSPYKQRPYLNGDNERSQSDPAGSPQCAVEP